MLVTDIPVYNRFVFFKQSDIKDDSPCQSCEDFVTCREYRHVCWRDVVLAYGRENWDFPGLFCPKAPHVEKAVFV